MSGSGGAGRPAADGSRLRALVVQSRAESRRLLKDLLLERGIEAFAFASARTAWRRCQRQRFDLAILERQEPGKERAEGLELCRRIRELPWGELVDILVLTSSDDPEGLLRILDSGADDYVVEPIEVGRFAIRIAVAERRLANRRMRQSVEAALLSDRADERTAELERSLERVRVVEAKRRLLSAAVEQSREGVIITDADGTIEYVNRAFEEITGYVAAQAVGINARLLSRRDLEVEHYRAMWETLSLGETWVGQVTERRADGTPFEEDLTVSPIRDEGGAVSHYVAVLRDVTEELAFRERLDRESRMSALGQFAEGIAHDFGNLVMVMQAASELLLPRLEDEEHRGQVDFIRRSCGSLADLIRSLLSLGRRQMLEFRDVDLNRLVKEAEPMLRRLLPADIDLLYEPGSDLGNVRGDRGRLLHVLLNLCSNARDAISGGGEIVIETGNRSIGSDYVRECPWATEGPHVYFSVRDNGSGMDAETQARVFDPFFTTKGPTRGTGLGLASALSTVKQHLGAIEISSSPGEGAVVTVYLPERASEGVPAEDVTSLRTPGGNERLLLVEDHADLRVVLCAFLETLGYRADFASDGQEALEILRRSDESFDLVVTDVVMPRMGGPELCRLSRESDPDLGFLFCSGHTVGEAIPESCRSPRTAFLPKPFDLEDLAQKVRSVLDRAREQAVPRIV